MNGIKAVNKNPAEQTAQNFMVAANALAQQQTHQGYPTAPISAANARSEMRKMIRMAVAFADPTSANHNKAYNALREQIGDKADKIERGHSGESAMNAIESIGANYASRVLGFAEAVSKKTGVNAEAAIETAYNALAGNPVYDHFANLNLLAAQQYQDMTGVSSYQESGDAMAVPTEPGSTGTDSSRFRFPYEQVTGSAKRYQGDLNSTNTVRNDENRVMLNLYNDFKNAVTAQAVFSITQDERNNALGYARAVDPALGGFILQNRYFGASQQECMKLAELWFWDGQDVAGSYIPGVGGSYGLLSSAINFHLNDWDQSTPAFATTADYAANPTKLIQKIQNFNFLPSNAGAPLPGDIDPSLMYKDIVRLVGLYYQQYVDFGGTLTLRVPTSWYNIAVQYPGTQSGSTGQGTFNKQLDEMVRSATSGNVKGLNILPSPMLNYRAANSYGSTAQPYNYMALTANGCPQEKKPTIMPGRTAAPVVVSESVNQMVMNFYTQYLTGGFTVAQLGGTFLLEFSATYP